MNISFENKTVLITGASRGVGAATAQLFAGSGAEVVVHFNKNSKSAEAVLHGLPGSGHMITRADMANPDDLRNMVDEVMSKKSKIDILVNNAGIYDERPDWTDMDFTQWQVYWGKTINTNLAGAANLSFLVVKAMIEQGGGKIVNITSRGAFRGEPDALPYGVSKAGLNSFGQSMAKKLASKDIFVFTLAPGFIYTDMTKDILESDRGLEVLAQSPTNRVATPEEIAQAVMMLAADGNEYMTGCVLDMNGASYLR
jgi:NAD(P)-dependent dehydrogenase (short-subunit alcohol dehydrogenase family)